ncbi:unnamed protein product, partial [Prorocentrum cordatum]
MRRISDIVGRDRKEDAEQRHECRRCGGRPGPGPPEGARARWKKKSGATAWTQPAAAAQDRPRAAGSHRMLQRLRCMPLLAACELPRWPPRCSARAGSSAATVLSTVARKAVIASAAAGGGRLCGHRAVERRGRSRCARLHRQRCVGEGTSGT